MNSWEAWLKPELLRFLKYVNNPWVLSFFWVAGLAILVLPSEALRVLRLPPLRDTYRGWIGAVTFLSFVGFLVWLTRHLALLCGTRKSVRRSLSRLSPSEKAILRYCLDHGQDTVTLELQHPTVSGLLAKGLVRASPIGNPIEWSCTIPQYVWSRLQRDRFVLQVQHPDDDNVYRDAYQWVSGLNNTASQ